MSGMVPGPSKRPEDKLNGSIVEEEAEDDGKPQQEWDDPVPIVVMKYQGGHPPASSKAKDAKVSQWPSILPEEALASAFSRVVQKLLQLHVSVGVKGRTRLGLEVLSDGWRMQWWRLGMPRCGRVMHRKHVMLMLNRCSSHADKRSLLPFLALRNKNTPSKKH